ncbi:hypothetical protein KR032_009602, partial [Drosophila birchii]
AKVGQRKSFRRRLSQKKSKTSLSPFRNLAELFKDTVEPAQLDLLVDLNEEFFQHSYLLVQSLSSLDTFVAGKIKLYVDILARLHAHYATEVEEVNTLRLKVKTAEEKLELALQTTSTTEAMMEKLRKSLENAWRNDDATKNREENIQMQLQTFVQTEQLDYSKVEATQKYIYIYSKNDRIRKMVFRERDRLAAELKDYEKRLATHRHYSEHLEDMLELANETLGQQQARVKKTESAYLKLERKTNLELESYQERQNQLGKEIAALQQKNLILQQVQGELTALTAAHEALKQKNEHLSRDKYNLSKARHKQEEKKSQLQRSLKLAEELNNVQRRNNYDLELARSHAEQNAKKKAEESLNLERRFRQVAKKNSDLNDQALTDRNQVRLLEKKILLLSANLDEVTNQNDEITKTRDKLRLEITRLHDTVAFVRHEIYGVRNQKEDVQVELVQVRKLLDLKNVEVQKIARHRQELFLELNNAEKTIGGLDERLADKTVQLEATQLQLQQKQQDFFKIKKQMEILHTDKMMLAKSLETCSCDRAAMQTTMAKLAHQIDQQNTALSANDKVISSLKNQIEQLGRAIRQKQNEIHAKDVLLASTRSDVRELKIRLEQRQQTIDTDEKRFIGLSCVLEEERKKKNLVGLQMVRQNDCVRLLRNKLTLMQKAFDKGIGQYNQRLEDIRLLKLEVTNLRMSHECMQKEVGNRAELRQDVIRLERQLNQERLKVSAYLEELSRPCRIHRWRVLSGKDPRRFDLICKVQSLLKMNLRLSVERENLAKELAEAKSLYKDYKYQIERLACPQIHEKLFLQTIINRRQKRRLKAMTAELRINEIDLQTRDCLIKSFQEQMRLQH